MLRRSASILLCLAASAGLVPWGCSSSSPQCQVGADCASGICESNGKCGPVSTAHSDSGTTGSDGGAPGDDGGAGDAPDDSPVVVGDTGSPFPGVDGGLCVPDNNGVITRDEVPMQAGLHANFEFAENVTVDSAGVMNANGSFTWDLTGPFQPSGTMPHDGDHTVLVTTNDPTGQWFSSAFAGATYTTKLSDTANLLGVFEGTQLGAAAAGRRVPHERQRADGAEVRHTRRRHRRAPDARQHVDEQLGRHRHGRRADGRLHREVRQQGRRAGHPQGPVRHVRRAAHPDGAHAQRSGRGRPSRGRSPSSPSASARRLDHVADRRARRRTSPTPSQVQRLTP